MWIKNETKSPLAQKKSLTTQLSKVKRHLHGAVEKFQITRPAGWPAFPWRRMQIQRPTSNSNHAVSGWPNKTSPGRPVTQRPESAAASVEEINSLLASCRRTSSYNAPLSPGMAAVGCPAPCWCFHLQKLDGSHVRNCESVGLARKRSAIKEAFKMIFNGICGSREWLISES